MNRYVSVTAMVAVAITLAACDRGPLSPKGAMNATFDLKSINGTSMPYNRTLGTASMLITSDVLILRDNGSYEDSTTYAFDPRAMQTGTSIERGRYSVSGSTISFVDETHGGRYSASLNGTTLTQSVNGNTPVYERR
ncbi:MAG TPA: hypothetical protein VJN70_12755 [Gemmatimonadaceae bacterium]|nr:hypothetical protein [Gemmatimonadaceae bacterium]